MIPSIRLLRNRIQCKPLHSSLCGSHLATLSTKSSSPTLLYFQNTYGLSLTCATEKIPKCATEDVDKIVNMLMAHGMTNAQITSILSLRPNLLISDLERTLKPNIEVFESLGISGHELGKLAAKKPKMLETEAKKVVELLKEYNLTNEEISAMSKKQPLLYQLSPDAILRPKLEYFKSSGFSDEQVRKLISSEPVVLRCSLQNKIIPAITLLRQYFKDDAHVIRTFQHLPWAPADKLKKSLEENFHLFKSHGIPSSLLPKLFIYNSSAMLSNEERLKKILKEVSQMGIVPTSGRFVAAIRTRLSLSRERWEAKLNIYRSFGLSEEEISTMLRMRPLNMVVSEEKIKENLGFFINRLKVSPTFIRTYTCAVQMSMKNRILPRCAVIEILAKKQLINSFKIGRVVYMSEKKFAEKIIEKYKSAAPEILKANKGQLAFEGFPDGFVLF